MYDNIVYSGFSSSFLEKELATVKGLLSKVTLMKKPDNFTYVDCADLCRLLETLKSKLEWQVKEAKRIEGKNEEGS